MPSRILLPPISATAFSKLLTPRLSSAIVVKLFFQNFKQLIKLLLPEPFEPINILSFARLIFLSKDKFLYFLVDRKRKRG